MIAGLAERGVRLAQADEVIGTSAGSLVGAWLAGGRDFAALAAEQAAPPAARRRRPRPCARSGDARPDLPHLDGLRARRARAGARARRAGARGADAARGALGRLDGPRDRKRELSCAPARHRGRRAERRLPGLRRGERRPARARRGRLLLRARDLRAGLDRGPPLRRRGPALGHQRRSRARERRQTRAGVGSDGARQRRAGPLDVRAARRRDRASCARPARGRARDAHAARTRACSASTSWIRRSAPTPCAWASRRAAARRSGPSSRPGGSSGSRRTAPRSARFRGRRRRRRRTRSARCGRRRSGRRRRRGSRKGRRPG